MKVNKLKLAALALSAVTCVTSIPSMAFAEDFAAAFTSGGEAEELSAAVGSAEAEEFSLFTADDSAVGEDAFDVFLFDDGSVEAQSDSTYWTFDPTSVKFYFNDVEDKTSGFDFPDYTVTYTMLDKDGKTVIYDDEKTKKPFVSSGKAYRIEETGPDCNKSFKLAIDAIPEFPKVAAANPDSPFVSKETFTSEDKPHQWDEDHPIIAETAGTASDDVCVPAGTGTKDYRCTVCGTLRSAVDSKNYPMPYTIPAKEHDWKVKETYYVAGDNILGVAAEGSSSDSAPVVTKGEKIPKEALDADGKPQAADKTKKATYTVVTSYVCANNEEHTKKEEKEETIEPSAAAKVVLEPETEVDKDTKLSLGNLADSTFNTFLNKEYPSDDVKTLPQNDDIVLLNCDKDGYYFMTSYDGEGKVLGKEKVTVTAHHTKGSYEISVGDKKKDKRRTIVDLEGNISGIDKAGKASAEAGIGELKVTVDPETKEIKVESSNCLEYEYTLTVLCKVADKDGNYHEISSTKGTAASNGVHLYDEATAKKVEEYKKQTERTVDGLTKEIGAENKIVKVVLPEVANCDDIKSVIVRYTCPICGKTKDDTVELTKAPAHVFGEKTIENSKPATCTEDGGFDQVQKCENCDYVKTTHMVYPHKGHVFNSDDEDNKDTSRFKVVLEGKLVIDDDESEKCLANQKYPYPTKDNTVGFSKGIVKAVLYDTCVKCGELDDSPVADEVGKANITVDKLELFGGKYCQEGRIYLTAEFKNSENKTVTATGDYPYYANELDYQGRTAHIAGRTEEVTISEATETTGREYWEVTYCRLCDQEMGREKRSGAPLGHKHVPVAHEAVAPTCTEDGMLAYYTCDTEECAGKYYIDAECEHDRTLEELVDPAKGHTESDAFIDPETVVEPEDYKDGQQDMVVICTVCGEELSRETEAIPCKAPTPAKVFELHTQVYPSTGSMYVYFNPVEGADTYRINYRVSGTTEWNKYEIPKVELNSNGKVFYTLTGLTKGEKYETRVAAGRFVYDNKGEKRDIQWGVRSDYNRRLLDTTQATVTKGSIAGTIDVKWDAIENASKYVIYYATNKNMSDQKVLTVTNGKATAATVSDLKSGTKYYVRVRPYTKVAGKLHSGSLSNTKAAKAK